MKSLLIESRTAGKLVTDAHLAALAVEHNAVLHTHDHDFQRFSGLRKHDPLAI
jgi:predicted nucleic acid-binding protein